MKLGIICGSGFEDLKLENLVIVKRHGEDHSIAPKRIDHRRNIKELLANGVTHVLVLCASGMLDRKYKMGDLIQVSDFIDITRQEGFYDDVAFDSSKHHVGFERALDNQLGAFLASLEGVRSGGVIWHWEGHRFQTRAEVRMISQFSNLINMTAAKEIEMAHEVGLKVGCISIGTDYAENPEMGDISKVMRSRIPAVTEIIKKTERWVQEQ